MSIITKRNINVFESDFEPKSKRIHLSIFQNIIDAIIFQNLETLFQLMPKGFDINQQDQDGNTLLMVACSNRQVDAVQFILDAGANPNILNAQNRSAITLLVMAKDYSLVKLLLRYGAVLNLGGDKFEIDYVYKYLSSGDKTLFKFLIERKEYFNF